MRKELKHFISTRGSIRSLILGLNDGLVSILALVAGVTGGTYDSDIIILAGIAGAIAGAISMAFGNYISIKSEIELYHSEIEREKREIKERPKDEVEEVREIYRQKGFRGKQLEVIVKHLTSNEKRWLDVMMKEELGLFKEKFESPVKLAAITGVVFILASIIPIVPYFFLGAKAALVAALIMTGIALFGAGAAKTLFTKKSWIISGIEMLVIGMLATAATFTIGSLFPVILAY
jgi:VIT1/CCC1 family predicted Fe2+/Mn2+ transporter